jgi:hypothetical protein
MGAQLSFADFLHTTTAAERPPDLDPSLQALWHDARGHWDGAHALAQAAPDLPGGAWVHAYLHRKEGDVSNAGYWYRRAGRPAAKGDLRAEWEIIARTLLADPA